MSHADFEYYYARWAKRIQYLARRLADGDHDLADDLEQTGRCALWRLEMENITGDRERYIWSMLRHQMIDVLRQERREHSVMLWRPSKAVRPRLALVRVILRRRGAPQHRGAAPYREDDAVDAA
jgi:hypothetical protein